MPQLLDALPALYRSLLPDFFRSEVPDETKATCSKCAMCEANSQGMVDAVDGVNRFFRPDTKCCTYNPRIPNYLVGALLSDPDPALAEGRRRMEEKISSRSGVTPQWVKPSGKYNLLYNNTRQTFGRSAALRCPYFHKESGGCTIWPYREAVCSTYYCKYVAGADGRTFWMSVKGYVSLAEIQLGRYATLKLHPDVVLGKKDRPVDPNAAISLEELEESGPSAKDYAELWGAWAGREIEFYKACFEIVRAVPAEELQRLLGLDGTIEQQVVEKHYRAAVAPKLPKVLRLNPAATVKWLPDGSVALASYSDLDAIALAGAAYPLLVEFTGREPVEAVRARLREQKQADLDDDVLLVLYRHRVLIEA